MKKFKLSMLILMSMLVFSACGGGGGGSDDPKNPGDPKDPTATLEINGDTYTYTLPGGTEFNLMLTPDVATTKTFPCNIDANDYFDETTDVANVPECFIMGETEVTYQLWKEVYDWATNANRGAEKYSFDLAGREGNDGIVGSTPTEAKHEPVTYVSCRDSIVWCNALTEYYNANNGSGADLVCVYTYDGSIIRDSRDSNSIAFDNVVQNSSNKGFRLPGSVEWEYVARYIGTTAPSYTNYVLKDGVYYSKGKFASGATAACDNESATRAVAWYYIANTSLSTHSVKLKTANALGLYDMSGNVDEWFFDIYSGSYRGFRGGCFDQNYITVQVGKLFKDHIFYASSDIGFRICRSR